MIKVASAVLCIAGLVSGQRVQNTHAQAQRKTAVTTSRRPEKACALLLQAFQAAPAFNPSGRVLRSPLVKSASHPLRRLARVQRRATMTVQTGKVDFSPLRRNLISGVALAGAAETTWLTLEKLGILGDSTLCTSEACSLVLGGPYGSVAGIPLTLFGALAYTTVLVLAQAPDKSIEIKLSEERTLTASTKQALLAVSTSMAVFSAYLIVLLAFVIKAPCPYCILSAVLSAAQVNLVWWGGEPLPSRQASLSTSAGAALLASLMAVGLFLQADGSSVQNPVISADVKQQLLPVDSEWQEFRDANFEQRTPGVLRESSTRALDIAKRLRGKGATMYGAYWCSHCYNQKNTLGKQAMSILQYKECGETKVNSDRGLCKEKLIKGFPTWEIDGKFYRGEKTLDKLEEILNTGEESSNTGTS